MLRIFFVVVSLLGISILATALFLKSPENQNLTETAEAPKVAAQSIPSSVPETPSHPIIKENLPSKIEIPPVPKIIPVPAPPSSPAVAPELPILATATASPPEIEVTKLPPFDEERILSAVVKIQCPTVDGLGKYIGSGFVTQGRAVVTAAHVIKDSASETCEVIFPRERKPIHYLKGNILNLKETARRHDEEGIDVGILILPELSSYPEAQAIFPSYPSISYPICRDSSMLGDKLLHFGYPSNYVDQTYLSKLEGEAVVNAAIQGIEDRLSLDKTYSYKSPVFGYTYDESNIYPYMVSRVASFYGDSGGLAFNVDKQCIIGPHRGGTIGKAAGENFSVFMNLGWNKAFNLLP